MTATAAQIRAITKAEVLNVMLGLDGRPDPVMKAIGTLNIPAGIERDDLLQDCRLKVIEAAVEADPKKGVSAFAYNIARRHAIDVIEKHNNRHGRNLPLPRQLAQSESPDFCTEVDPAIEQVLSGLDSIDKKIFELHAIDLVPATAIGSVVGCCVEYVRDSISGTRAKLKAALSA